MGLWSTQDHRPHHKKNMEKRAHERLAIFDTMAVVDLEQTRFG